MKKIIKNGFGLLFLLLSTSVMADDFYFGARVGGINPAVDGQDINTSNTYRYGNVFTVGGLVGLKVGSNLFVEGDISTNVASGKVKNVSDNNTNDNLKWNITTISIHGLYKSSGKIHARIKAGLTNIMLSDPSNFGVNSWYPNDDAVNFSYGAGVGFVLGSGKEVIFEFTQLSDRFSSINFGINF